MPTALTFTCNERQYPQSVHRDSYNTRESVTTVSREHRGQQSRDDDTFQSFAHQFARQLVSLLHGVHAWGRALAPEQPIGAYVFSLNVVYS